MRPIVLSIGTTDPWVAAGVLLDDFVADRLQIRIVNCIVAVSAQDGAGAFAFEPISASMIEAQLAALSSAPIAAMRIGALQTVEQVEIITEYARAKRIPTVLDPVIATSSGGRFLSDATLAVMKQLLFPALTLLTPNLYEAQHLSGISITGAAEMETAARRIAALGPSAVLIKGGHLNGAAIDVLWDGTAHHCFAAERLPHDMRGTGCVLAIAATASLAAGKQLLDAVTYARTIVRTYMQSARPVGEMRIVP